MKRTVYFMLILMGLFVVLTSEIEYSSGSPGGKTGSPGDGGNTCTDCHGGTATFQAGWIESNIPPEGYIPGQTYTVTATGTHNGVVKFGFEVTSEDQAAAKTGTIQVTNANEMKLVNSGNSVTHKSGGTTPTGNSRSWTFDWMAPAEGTGDVTFYGAFNAANGNGNNSGDVIYTSTLEVAEAVVIQTGLTLNLTGMTPHVGQLLEARLIDKTNGMEMERLTVAEISSADFTLDFGAAEDNNSYWIDFYADHNDNGYYDGIPTDHAWRITVNDFMEGATINFQHNTNFSEIDFRHMYKLEFQGMSPHIGQQLEVRLVNMNSGQEYGRVKIMSIPSEEFDVFLPYLVSGESYFVDFYADHNGNGTYDAPPADHAWRMELTDVEGDEDDTFVHNTNFTDIGWKYRFTLSAMGMNPHLGQMFELRLVNQNTLAEAGRIRLDSIVSADFSASLAGLEMGEDYFIDFYADHNGNGTYDAPPTDHAWRLELMDVIGDSQLDFSHNTNFTDIQWPLTGISDNRLAKQFVIYPNPVLDHFTIKSLDTELEMNGLILFNSSGTVIAQILGENIPVQRFNMSELNPGIYYLKISLENGAILSKPVIKL